MNNILTFEYSFNRESDLYRKLLEVYSVMYNLGLTGAEVEVLVMYLRHGFSTEAKKVIIKELNFKSMNYINVINFKLKQKGMLIDSYNRNKKELAPLLVELKKFVALKRKKKMLPLIFENADN